MSAASRRLVKEVLRLMKERGWERLGRPDRVMFKHGSARLNWGEAVQWLTDSGALPASEARPR